MKKNMGQMDRIIRSVIAAILVIVILTGQVSGLTATILGVFAAIFIVTSILSYCPLYSLFKLNTRGKHQAA